MKKTLLSLLTCIHAFCAAQEEANPWFINPKPSVETLANFGQKLTSQQPQIYIAVSHSMPTASLQKLSHDASRVGATLVIRGFIGPTMMTTAQAIQEYNKQGVQVQIHPQIFSFYGINVVPTFIVVEPPTSACIQNTACPGSPFTAVAGDVSLLYALDEMAKSTKEQNLLQTIRNAQNALTKGQ